MVLFLALIIIAVKLIYDECQPTLPAGYHNNRKLEMEDADKVRFGQMSKREFLRNMDRGKYR